MKHPRWILGCLAVCLVIGCADLRADRDKAPTAGQKKQPNFKSVLIKDVPFVEQKPDFCGEACAEMYLKKLGKQMDQDYVFDQAGLSPLKGRGCYSKELAGALKNIGFRIGPVWSQVSVDQLDRDMQFQFKALLADLQAGVPSIICTRYDEKPETTEHFRLILGYDSKTDEVIYHEPAVGRGSYLRMSRAKFFKLWPLKYKAKQWTVVRMRLEPGRLKSGKAARDFTDADYAQHMMKLKKKIPDESFTVILDRPFFIIGDESAATVRRRTKNTIKWAVDLLKNDYFKKDPNEILDIWLFKDKESYEKNTLAIFKDKPTTPYGYYSSTHKALVMNISTGGGTLVHELVHPFIESNFPECPSWFNEGLASLYEQCAGRNGHIYGRTNWRLAGLKEAIKKKTVPTFKTLCSTTSQEFYSGDNYAQARYLCYYLQEKGVLRTFYHKFRENQKDDPTGYQTLVEILGKPDMDKFKKQWESDTMKLRFP